MRAEDDIDYTKVDFADLCTFLEYIELREFEEDNGGLTMLHAKSWLYVFI